MEEEGSSISRWMQLVVPQPCYDEYFIKFNFFDADCFKIVLSKCLGYAIIAGAVLVKVPQIVKILQAKSGEGINILSTTLELAAIAATLAYSSAQGYPFSAYGDAWFLLLQTLTIACLVLNFTNRQLGAFVYFAVFVSILWFILSPFMPTYLLWYLQASVLPNVVIARMLQTYTNYSNQSTGQLSLVTFLLLFLGSLARIFTSIQETGDQTIIMIYATSSTCNFIILSQILYYGSGKKVKTQ